MLFNFNVRGRLGRYLYSWPAASSADLHTISAYGHMHLSKYSIVQYIKYSKYHTAGVLD